MVGLEWGSRGSRLGLSKQRCRGDNYRSWDIGLSLMVR